MSKKKGKKSKKAAAPKKADERAAPSPPPTSRLMLAPFALVLLIVPSVYSSKLMDACTLAKALAVGALVLLALGLWMVRVAREKEPVKVRVPPLFLPAALYLAWHFVSWTQAVAFHEACLETAKLLVWISLALAAASCIRTDWMEDLATIWAIGSIPVSLLGLSQYLGADLWIVPASALPSATFMNRNMASFYLELSIPIAVWLAWGAESRWRTVLGAIAAALMLGLLVHTRSRGAWIAMASALVIAVVMILLRRRKVRGCGQSPGPGPSARFRTALSAASVAAFVGLLLLPSGIDYRRVTGNPTRLRSDAPLSPRIALSRVLADKSDTGRLNMWVNAARITKENFLLGVGRGNFACHAFTLKSRFGDFMNKRPHNDFLWVAAELGLPGLALWLWILAAIAWMVVRLVLRAPADLALPALGIGAGLAAVTVHSIFSFPGERATMAFFWLSAGLLCALYAKAFTVRERVVKRNTTIWLLAAGIGANLWAGHIFLRSAQAEADTVPVYALKREKSPDWGRIASAAARSTRHGPNLDILGIPLIYWKGKADYRLGRYEEAAYALDKTRGLSPYFKGGLVVSAANAYALAGSESTDPARRKRLLRESEAFAREAIRFYAQDIDARTTLAAGLYAQGDEEGALREIHRAFLVGPDHPEVLAVALRLARRFAKKGKEEYALPVLNDILENHPENTEALGLQAQLRKGGEPGGEALE